jgi:hypothetical protein
MTKSQALKKAKKLWGEDGDVSGRQSPKRRGGKSTCFVGVALPPAYWQMAIHGEGKTWTQAFANANQNGH